MENKGGFSIIYSQAVTFVNCSFIRNTAYNSALSISNSYYVAIENCYFEGNNVHLGGLRIEQTSSVTIENCHFERNSAKYGGAVYLQYSNVLVISCNFVENEAEKTGGSFYAFGNTEMILKVSQSSFRRGFAEVGGTFSVEGCDLVLNSSFIKENTAKLGVGGIHMMSTKIDKVAATICNSVLLNNSVAALYIRVSTIILKNITLFATSDIANSHINIVGDNVVLDSIHANLKYPKSPQSNIIQNLMIVNSRDSTFQMIEIMQSTFLC